MAGPPEAKTQIRFCSRCGVHPRAYPDSTNGWCLECNAAQSAKYNASVLERAERRAFVLGSEAMRAQIVYRLSQFPSAHFSGTEAAVIAQRVSVEVPATIAAPNGSGERD